LLGVRDRLGSGQNRVQRSGKIVLSYDTSSDVASGGVDLSPDLDDRVENLPLVGNVTPHAGDQIWNELAAAAKLNIDLGPRISNAVPVRHKPVVGPH
jgi:hypothetical protein